MTNSTARTCKALLMTLTLSLMMFNVAFAGWDEGVAAFKAGNYKLAAKEFKAATVQNPDTWGNHYMLGVTLTQVGKKELALKHFQAAYDLNPNDLAIKDALGRSLKTSGDIQKAAISFVYSTALFRLGMKEEGQKALKAARELDPAYELYKKPVRG